VSDLDDLRQRVTALENQVAELRESRSESRRAADLFALVDRDVADLTAAFSGQRQVLQALRDTQLEQGQVLAQHGQALAEQGQALGAVLAEIQAHGRVLARLDPGDPSA
jgi:chromosome segregation ATPase